MVLLHVILLQCRILACHAKSYIGFLQVASCFESDWFYCHFVLSIETNLPSGTWGMARGLDLKTELLMPL